MSDDDDLWFRQPWEDEEPEPPGKILPKPLEWKRPEPSPTIDPAFLKAFANCEHTIARLDAATSMVPEPVRQGLVARIGFREASGWLAQASQWVHPDDLALRDLGLTGSYMAAVKSGKLEHEMPNTLSESSEENFTSVAEDRTIALGITLARLLYRMVDSQTWLPTKNVIIMQRCLDRLGLLSDPLREPLMAGWIDDLEGDLETLPPMLAAFSMAAKWRSLDDGDNTAEVDLRCGFLLVAILKRAGWLRSVPLPFWTSRTIKREISSSMFSNEPKAKIVLLDLITESALSSLRELDRLLQIYHQAMDFASGCRKSSRLREAIIFMISVPVVMGKSLAKQLGISFQGATGLLRQMEAEKLIKESTGRKSYRGFVM